MNRIHTVSALVTAAFISLAGCQKAEQALAQKAVEKAVEAQTGGKVELSNTGNGQLTFKDKDKNAELNIGNNKLPDDLPKTIPVYPGSTVAMSSHQAPSNPTKDKNVYVLYLSTPDDSDKVLAYYKGEIKRTAKQEMNAGTTHMLVYEDSKEPETLSVTVSGDKGKTMIQLGYQFDPSKK